MKVFTAILISCSLLFSLTACTSDISNSEAITTVQKETKKTNTENNMESTKKPADLLLGSWKTVNYYDKDIKRTADDMKEMGMKENLIVTPAEDDSGKDFLKAEYRAVYPIDIAREEYRVEIKELPITELNPALKSLETNQSWSAELINEYDEYNDWYLVLEQTQDGDVLKFIMVDKGIIGEAGSTTIHEMVRTSENDEIIEFKKE